jgi:transcriptional regulator of met regulon
LELLVEAILVAQHSQPLEEGEDSAIPFIASLPNAAK